MIKILHVLYSPRAEGTPRLVLDWLTVKGYDQEIVFLTPDGELRETFERTKVWQYYNTDFDPRFINAFKIAGLVKQICLERKPDIVIAWYLGFSHWIALGARRGGVRKNIAHAGNPASDKFVGKYIHSWITFTLGKLFGNVIIACSEYVRNSFVTIPGVSAKNIFAVYNCTRIDLFGVNLNEPLPDRRKDFIMVATMEAHKDHLTLLQAWMDFDHAKMPSNLFLAGDGSLRKSLEAWSNSHGLKNIFFLGTRNDVPQLLHQCAHFVLSTTHDEGFGTVLIEAMAAGCSIIATDVEACKEVLQNGRYGRLVPAKNPALLLQAMEEEYSAVVNEKDQRDRLLYASEFSPEVMIRKYVDIVETRKR